MVKNSDMFGRFDTILAYDGKTNVMVFSTSFDGIVCVTQCAHV